MVGHPLHELMSEALIEGRLADLRGLIERTPKGVLGAADLAYFEGALARREGALVKAVEALEIAVEGQPDHVGAWGELGFAYVSAGRHAAAVAALKRALSYAPDEPTLLLLFGMACQITGDHGTAVRSFERVIVGDPGNWAAR